MISALVMLSNAHVPVNEVIYSLSPVHLCFKSPRLSSWPGHSNLSSFLSVLVCSAWLILRYIQPFVYQLVCRHSIFCLDKLPYSVCTWALAYSN